MSYIINAFKEAFKESITIEVSIRNVLFFKLTVYPLAIIVLLIGIIIFLFNS